MGDVFDHFDQFTGIVMFAFHHADWSHRLATHALFDHREQDLLFFHHMAGQFFMQHGQVFRQTAWYVRFICVNAFNFRGLQNQFRQLFAVSVVITHDDMIDDFSQCHGTPVFLQRLFSQLRELCLNNV